jgi:hypothetical protein
MRWPSLAQNFDEVPSRPADAPDRLIQHKNSDPLRVQRRDRDAAPNSPG